jgi:hypothetical protein
MTFLTNRTPQLTVLSSAASPNATKTCTSNSSPASSPPKLPCHAQSLSTPKENQTATCIVSPSSHAVIHHLCGRFSRRRQILVIIVSLLNLGHLVGIQMVTGDRDFHLSVCIPRIVSPHLAADGGVSVVPVVNAAGVEVLVRFHGAVVR